MAPPSSVEAVGRENPALEQLRAHANFHKLGPVRAEIAVLLALNEYDPVTGVYSSASYVELERKYRGYTRHQFKHTFDALRRYGIAEPKERFEDCEFGRRQIGTEYRLASGTAPFVNEDRVARQRRAAAARRRRRDAGVLGKIPFTARDDKEIQSLVRNRRG